MTIEFPPCIEVYCDGDGCMESLEVDIFWESQNTTPMDDILNELESNKWTYEGRVFMQTYCPKCSRNR